MRTRSTRQRLVHGLGALFYGQLVAIVVQLVGVPILLHAWGVRLYGEWLILFAVPSYLSMMDLGFAQSAANDMTARYACGDRAGTLSVFQSLAALIYLSCGVGFLIFTLSVWILPIQQWLHLTELSTDEVRGILWLLGAELLIKLTDGINHAGFRSHGEYGFHVALSYTTLLLQFATMWTVALLGYGLLAAAAAFTAVRAVITPVIALLLLLRHRNLSLGVGHANRRVLRALAKPALANVSTPLAMVLSIQGMVLLVAAVLGPLAVVTFVTLRTLTRLISQTVWRVSHAFEPELAAAWGAEDGNLLRRLYEHALRMAFWLALPAAVGLWGLGPWILKIWTHGKVIMDAGLFRWLLLSALASVIWYGALNLLKAANTHLHAALWYVFSSGAAVVLAAALLINTGRLADVGVALLLADLLLAVYLWRAAAHMLNAKSRSLILRVIDVRPLIQFIVNRRIFHDAH